MPMAGDDDLDIIEVSSSSEGEEKEEEEEEEEKLDSSVQVIRTRKRIVHGRNLNQEVAAEEDEEECVVLEVNPFEEVLINTLAHFSGRLSLSSDPRCQEEFLIIAERGQVAGRDYPHPRHQCALNPFDETPHEKYCQKCYCYVCDKAAPCEYWKRLLSGHCHASEKDNTWKRMRIAHRSNSSAQAVIS